MIKVYFIKFSNITCKYNKISIYLYIHTYIQGVSRASIRSLWGKTLHTVLKLGVFTVLGMLIYNIIFFMILSYLVTMVTECGIFLISDFILTKLKIHINLRSDNTANLLKLRLYFLDETNRYLYGSFKFVLQLQAFNISLGSFRYFFNILYSCLRW